MTDQTADNFTALQRVFDFMSPTPGAILYRGPDRWRALEPGNIGDILVIGPDGLPRWQAP